MGSSSSLDDSADRGINFTMFLTMMSEHLIEFDTEAELVEAFACFDEGDTGMVKGDEIRKWLSETGDRMDQKEVSTAPPYVPWRILRYACSDRQVPERIIH